MEITLLGGAKEVGASCVYVETQDAKFIIDSGIRIKVKEGTEAYPNFDYLNDKKNIDFIVVSHGHLDHIGTLPILNKIYPNAVIYTTEPTKQLIKILLLDSLKIMEAKEEELPIFSEEDIINTLNMISTVKYDKVINPKENVYIKFIPAGHIIGASSILIQTKEGSIFYSGDISLTQQHTVDKADIKQIKNTKTNVLILESTYGNKLQTNRKEEEEKLYRAVSETIKAGGKVLIPVFAIGRGQEVIISLKEHMQKHNEKFDIYVDGMVREVNKIYKNYENYVNKKLRKKILKGEDVFSGETIHMVKNKEEREKILKKAEPCVIISSSGMLTGGPAVLYAKEIIKSKKNLIALTGYQDEESNGFKLLKLVEDNKEEEKEIELEGSKYKVYCDVKKYGLSAHADRLQLLQIANSIDADHIILNHGDNENIKSLKNYIDNYSVYIPKNKKTIIINSTKIREPLKKEIIPSLNIDEPPNKETIKKLWEYMTQKGYTGIYKIYELSRIYNEKNLFRQELEKILPEVDYIEEIINKKIYKILSEEEYKEKITPKPMEQNELRKFLLEELKDFNIYEVSMYTKENKAVLKFITPYKIQKEKSKIKELEEKTLWKLEISPNINTQIIEEELKDKLPKEYKEKVKISIFPPKILLKKIENIPEEIKQMITNDIKDKYDMEVEIEKEKRQEKDMKPKTIKENKIDFNKARELLLNKYPEIYKISLINDEIVIKFINSQIAQIYQKEKEYIEKELLNNSWEIKIDTNYNNIAEMTKIIKEICHNNNTELLKDPQYRIEEKKIKISIKEYEGININRIREEIENKILFQVEIMI